MKRKPIPAWAWYAGLPILCLLLWWLQRDRLDLLRLTLREIVLIFGYIAAVGDGRRKIVPNRLILCMLGVWWLMIVPQLLLQTERTIAVMVSGVLGLLISGILLLLVYWLSRKGLGGGDVKFMAVSGLYLGIDLVLSTMLIGSLLAAITGILLIALKKIQKSDAIPLIPFLYVGMVVTTSFS